MVDSEISFGRSQLIKKMTLLENLEGYLKCKNTGVRKQGGLQWTSLRCQGAVGPQKLFISYDSKPI